MSMSILRAYRSELDPTVEQRKQLARQAGAARWAHNWALAEWRRQHAEVATLYPALKARLPEIQDDATRAFAAAVLEWKHRREEPSAFSLCTQLTPLKRTPELGWLREVSAYVVREGIADVGAAYAHFFRRLREGVRGREAGEPRFRSRNEPAGKGFRIAQPQAISATDRAVKIAGVGEVKLKRHGYVPVGARYRGLSCREIAGRWYVAVQVEEPDRAPQPAQIERMGVEVGVNHIAVTSTGKRFGAMSSARAETGRDADGMGRARRRLALWQRRMARRYKRGISRREQSAGWHEAVREVAKYNARLARIRQDTLHQVTARVVRQQAATIVMRDMRVKGMIGRAGKDDKAMRTRNALAPMVSDVAMYELRRQVEYKQAWAGRTVVTTPPCHPTTRMCSMCGAVRETETDYPDFVCSSCGHREDREANAARNLETFVPENTPGGTGGRIARRKMGASPTTTSGTGTPDAGEQLAPTVGPDGDATSPLGPGNRAPGRASSGGKGVGNHDPTGGAVSVPPNSIPDALPASTEVTPPTTSLNPSTYEPATIVRPGPLASAPTRTRDHGASGVSRRKGGGDGVR